MKQEESRSKKACGAVDAVRLPACLLSIWQEQTRAPPPPPALWTWSRYFRCNYSMDAGEEGGWHATSAVRARRL